MQHLYQCPTSFIPSNDTNLEGFPRVTDGDFALHVEHGVVSLTRHEGAWVYQRLGYAGFGDDLNNLKPICFELATSENGMNAIDLRNPDPVIRAFVVSSIRENLMTAPAYIARVASSAFLQANSKSRVLVEFWLPNHDAFIAHLNAGFKGWYNLMLELEMLEYQLENMD
ncbi:MAG: hypothetical protein RSD49_21660 [Hafnia sp.]